MPKLEKRGGTYSFRCRSNGRLVRVNTGETEHIKARLYMEDYLYQQSHSQHRCASGKYDINTLSWKDFCEQFMLYSRSVKSAPEADIRVIRAINSVLGISLFKDLNAPNIRKYIDYRLSVDHLKENSVNRDLHSIKSMWKFATTELFDDIKNEASLVKEIPTEKLTKTKFFTEEEIKKILSGSDSSRITIACYLMLYLGLRLKEACLTQWKDILFDKNVVMVYPHKTKRSNPRPSAVPLNAKLKQFLLSIPRKSNYVIGLDMHSRQELVSFSNVISKYFRRLGISGTAHTCRHTFISHLIMKGVDGSVVQRWARIAKPEILQVYLHLSPKYTNEAINLLPY